MLKVADLAGRADFDVGPLHISPGRRLVVGPSGSANVEPIVMKVFLLLIDAAGKVVTRDDLFENAWGGVFVGDDSLNRAIARVRKIAAETAPGLFKVETIPRTGYRITGPLLDQFARAEEVATEPPFSLSRRAVVGAGALSLAALAGGGWWLVKRRNDEQRFDELVKRGREALEYSDGSDEPAKLLRQAAALNPNDGALQGLLAFALVSATDSVNFSSDATAVNAAQEAADRSLRANPADPNARLAYIQLQRSTLDLAETERRLRDILRTAPNNLLAMQDLWNLLQTTGQSRQALALVQRSIAVRPLAAANHYPLAQLLWINGRVPEADRVIERALSTWPTHQVVRFARFTILAFTGRQAAARQMLQDPATRPQVYSPDAIALWELSLTALEQPSPANIARVREAYRAAVTAKPRLANQAVMVLSALGDVDAAFETANKLLLFRAGLPGRPARSTAWRFTPWLFTPPVAAMRADPRFLSLCDGTGLTDYWAKRGIRPDYRIGRR